MLQYFELITLVMQAGNSNSTLLAQLIPNTTATHTITYTNRSFAHYCNHSLNIYLELIIAVHEILTVLQVLSFAFNLTYIHFNSTVIVKYL